MRRVYHTFGVLTSLLIAAPALAGDWVQFGNETLDRIVADASIGVNDTEEKDYTWEDFDQDGDTDVVVVRKQPFTTPGRRRNVLFMNEGIDDGHAVNGVLVDRTEQYATAADDGGQGFLDLTNDRDVRVVDVNCDDWLDIVTATVCISCPGLPKTITHPRIYINLGNDAQGNWLGFRYEQARIPEFPITPNFCEVAAGDLTGDGYDDLYFVDYLNDLEDRLLINDGNGFFTDETEKRLTPQMYTSSFGTAVVIDDMNMDGWEDIVKSENGPVETFYNAGFGFFDILDQTYSGAAYHTCVADLNGDGLYDIIVIDDGIDRYLLNQGNGPDGMAEFQTFQFPVETIGFGSEFEHPDLDNDGWQDMIITDVDVDIPGCTRVTDIMRNNGNPPNVTFTIDSGGIPDNMLQGVHDVGVIDLNGDCWLDLVIGRCSGTQIWINQATTSACPCPADLDGSGSVGILDLLMLLAAWGTNPGGPPDFDGDGSVGILDLLELLANWGDCP